MKLNQPKVITWFISLLLGLLGIVLQLGMVSVPALAPFSFWLVAIGLILLLLATLLKGL